MCGGGGGVVAACSQHGHELSSVWGDLLYGRWCENKTIPPPSLSEPGRRGVGACSMSSSVQELYLIEGVGDCNE